MFNSNLILLFSAVLLSCSSVDKSNNMNKDFTLISAEKTTWFGGREGVKGTLYNFTLKNNQKQSFQFTKLRIGKDNYPLKTIVKQDSIFISASVTDSQKVKNIEVESGKEITEQKKEVENNLSLEYYLSNSKIIQSLPIKKITEKSSHISGDSLPN
ncbi:hypothetical protein [Halpernia sp.]|uniref:hypothetical protein n=1 Tax=Halpernia sp. TaxID=2782209 RepID=UPI003A91706E